jgi:UDP-3-O-[3-hydroxymyristoyl] glucosamine N-acyltransferase
MEFTVAEIAAQIGAEIVGDASLKLKGFAPADHASSGDLTFAENESYFLRAEASEAGAILVDGPFASTKKTVLRVPNARVAFARVLPVFYPESVYPSGIHPTAVIAASAVIDATAHIGPYCVVGEKVTIGARSVLQNHVTVGAGSRIGEDANLFPNTTLYPGTVLGNRVRIHSGTVVGSDGFGYVLDKGVHRKVPQMGNVVLGDDVELGANVTIDRGALGPTTIGRGTKIDNLVQIGHNVSIGDHCLFVSQVGVAGSTKLGNYCVVAGQAGLAGHLKIGNGVTIAAQSGVMRDIPDGQKVLGAPAMHDKDAKRQFIAIQRLPDLIRRVNDLEKQLAAQRDAEASGGKAPAPSGSERHPDRL